MIKLISPVERLNCSSIFLIYVLITTLIIIIIFWICMHFQILVPVPQYPLYSAAITLLGGSLIPYYLEETSNWGLAVDDLHQSVVQAKMKGITVRTSLVFFLIN